MKLAKKMLASALALAMVAALALTAFAATPVLSLTASDAVVGKEVTVTVCAKDIAGLQAADLVFKYDTTALEFVSRKSALAEGLNVAAGKSILTDDEVTCSVAYEEAATEDINFVTYTFKVLKAGATEIKGTVSSWTGTDKPADFSLTITAKDPAAETTAPVTAAPTTAPVTAAPVEDNSKVTPTKPSITQTGEASIAAIAGVMAIAAVAFVATRKKDEE